MSDVDALSRMARALRESRTGRLAEPSGSRAAVLTQAARQRRRKIGLVWLVPLAAVLVISTAVASVGPARRFALRMYIERIVGSDRGASRAAAPTPALVESIRADDITTERSDVTAVHDDAAAGNVAESTGARESGAVAAASRATPVAKVSRRSPATPRESPPLAEPNAEPVNPPPPAPPAVERDDDDVRLYARAHEAHFVQRNTSAALAAWDAYLASEPEGRFALEASYNRALCLVRLDRLDEAKAALRPFRDGRFGSYRQVEAKRLLDALNER